MLYLVGTPLGNLKDITLRAIETLHKVDVIVCEDTRVSLKLLNHYGIKKTLLSYHEHNEKNILPRLLKALDEGKNLAYITDGGMPLVSDPGFKLVLACQENKLDYTIIPGPSAPITALCLSGISPAKFLFCGFPSSKKNGKKRELKELKDIEATLIFFESSKRLISFLEEALEALGDRQATVCREMTKIFEEAKRDSLANLLDFYKVYPPKGEVVVVVEGNLQNPAPPSADTIENALRKALQTNSLKDAAGEVATIFNLPKREVYAYGLKLKEKTKGLS